MDLDGHPVGHLPLPDGIRVDQRPVDLGPRRPDVSPDAGRVRLHRPVVAVRCHYREAVATEVDPQHLLDLARGAIDRREYAVAYRTLREAKEKRALQPDGLSMLADAAWWLGQISECLTISESLHRRYLEDGNVERAALQALDIGGVWMIRGEYGLASGWVSKARRLLDGQPPGRGQGLLTYIDGYEALEEQRLDEATASARDLQRLGLALDDDTCTALGLLLEGLAEIRRGHLREGFALLDEAMLPVMADSVTPDWAGNIYCTIMSTCYDLMDLPRAREWTRATERWLSGFSDAVMFLGVCRAHRLQLHAVDGAWSEVEQEAAAVEHDLADMNIGARRRDRLPGGRDLSTPRPLRPRGRQLSPGGRTRA